MPPLRHPSIQTCRYSDMLLFPNPYPNGHKNCQSGGTFENNGSAATPTIRRQCRSGGMSEWMAEPKRAWLLMGMGDDTLIGLLHVMPKTHL